MCYGMIHNETGLAHGIVRKVLGSYLMEATYRNGQQHGLNRSIRRNVTVALYKDGSNQAYFRFDDSFKEDYSFGARG